MVTISAGEEFSPASQALMAAALAEDFGLVEQLVLAGAPLNVIGPDGETLFEKIVSSLHRGYQGASIGQVEMVSLLLHLGADPNLNGQSGPLVSPMLGMDVPMLSVMLAAGADPNLPFDTGACETLYDWATFDYVLEIWEYPYDFVDSPVYALNDGECSTEEAWLKRLDDLALQYGVRRPDHLWLLRAYGARSCVEKESRT